VARLFGLAAAGAVLALTHPPLGAAVLSLPAVSLALLLLRRAEPRLVAALSGFVLGAGMFGVLLAWSLRFGFVAWFGLVVAQALFFVPIGVAAADAAERVGGWRWVAQVVGTWTIVEALRARWPLGGFEWGQLGYAWHDTTVSRTASVVGVLGLTALTIAAGAVLVVALSRRHRLARPLLGLLGIAAVFLLLAGREWTRPAGVLDAAVVQVAPVCEGPVVRCPDEDERLFRAFVDATGEAARSTDLVVWGEGALGGRAVADWGPTLAAASVAPRYLLVGATAPVGFKRFVNANVLFGPGGSVLAEYRKRHGVPFGEFVPMRSLLGAVGEVGTLVPADLVPGERPGRLPVGDALLGTVSSFEASFARDVRRAAGPRPVDALVVLTAESSYGRSAVSDQFLAMAQVRAAELGKSVVVAATTGRSALFAPDGERLAVTPLLSPAVIEAAIPLRRGMTPYARVGDAPVLLASGLLLLGQVRGVGPFSRRWLGRNRRSD
jgi:apolipoprotein N-acyltransferase